MASKKNQATTHPGHFIGQPDILDRVFGRRPSGDLQRLPSSPPGRPRVKKVTGGTPERFVIICSGSLHATIPFEGTEEEASTMHRNQHRLLEEKCKPFGHIFSRVLPLDVWFESCKKKISDLGISEHLIWTNLGRTKMDGTYYLLDEWIKGVQDDLFDDADGRGYLGTDEEVSNLVVLPSQVMAYTFPSWATHVFWVTR